MNTLKKRIEEYLRINSHKDYEVDSETEEDYTREREKIDLKTAQESLDKLKRLSCQ